MKQINLNLNSSYTWCWRPEVLLCGLKLFFDEVLAVLKIDTGVRLGKFSVIVPSGWKFLHEETFLFDKCVKIVVVVVDVVVVVFISLLVCLFVFCIADSLTSQETVEDGLRIALRPACAKIVQSLSSLYDIWCPGFLFHQIVSLCKYSLYRGAKPYPQKHMITKG